MISECRHCSKEFKLEAIRMYENGERIQAEIEREWKVALEWQLKKEKPFQGMGD